MVGEAVILLSIDRLRDVYLVGREATGLNETLLPKRLVVWQLKSVTSSWKISCEFGK